MPVKKALSAVSNLDIKVVVVGDMRTCDVAYVRPYGVFERGAPYINEEMEYRVLKEK